MKELLIALLLSAVPSYEARYAIPTSLALTNVNPVLLFSICVGINLLVIPIVFLGLDFLAPPLRKRFEWVDSIFKWFLKRGKKRSWEFSALVLFVSTPIPGTGAYTGALMSYLFGLNRKTSAIAIGIGVLISSTITTLLSLGILSLAGL